MAARVVKAFLSVYVPPYLCYHYGVMVVAEEIKIAEGIQKLSRAWESAGRNAGGPASLAEVVNGLNNLRENISRFRRHVLELYDAAVLVTSSFKTPELAATAWESLRDDYSTVLSAFMKAPKIEPGIDGVIDEFRSVLRDLVEKSDQEYRAYTETAYLLGSPANALELREAIEEAKSGNLERFETMEDFKKSLRDSE
jgi:hypothetical protein